MITAIECAQMHSRLSKEEIKQKYSWVLSAMNEFASRSVMENLASTTPQVEVRDGLTESEWLKLHSGYYGDEIDNVKQLVKINFTGEELYEYCQHMFEMFKQTIPASPVAGFQNRVANWMVECFTPEITKDIVERNHRFLEESLELVQSLGCTLSESHQLVDYVFNRPIGEPYQEVGGVMVTLAALCNAAGLQMMDNGETELTRISMPEIIEKIRLKQSVKPKHSPLPQSIPVASGYTIEQVVGFAEWCINNVGMKLGNGEYSVTTFSGLNYTKSYSISELHKIYLSSLLPPTPQSITINK